MCNLVPYLFNGVHGNPHLICAPVIDSEWPPNFSIILKQSKTCDEVRRIEKKLFRVICSVQSTSSLGDCLLTRRCSNSAQKMDKMGQTKAEAAVMALSAGGQTNLWEGLVYGLEDLAKNKRGQFVALEWSAQCKPEPCRWPNGVISDGRLQTIMLLTDGLPNVSPPRGEAAMLKRFKCWWLYMLARYTGQQFGFWNMWQTTCYKGKRKRHHCQHLRFGNSYQTWLSIALPTKCEQTQSNCSPSCVRWPGFGYSLDTVLLRELAQTGMGSYAFIPVCVVVNLISSHCHCPSLPILASIPRFFAIHLLTTMLNHTGCFTRGHGVRQFAGEHARLHRNIREALPEG